MAALALMTAACSNDDNDLTTPQPQQAKGITITAQLAPKTGGATTRAVIDGGNKIMSDWAENEHLAVLYEVGGTKKVADATITAVDDDDYSATIEFTVEAGTPNNTACTLVYPLSAAKDDHTGVKDAATLLAAQDGTLNANLDVRVGAGTIQTTTPGLTVDPQPAAQFAIFKFTVKNADGSATIDVKPFIVSIDTYDYIVTPATATNELFVALPAISGKEVKFTAFDAGSNIYMNAKTGISFTAGSYYQSVVKLNASSLKALIIPKGTSALKGAKLLFYQTGDTYSSAAARSENKNGEFGWGTWANGVNQSTMFFKENGGAQADLSINGNQQFGKDGLNNTFDPSLNFYFVGTY
jgi:hypothetical protein